MDANFWTEIYDTKTQNASKRNKSAFLHCDECKAWQGHEITCSKVTIEHIALLLKHARKQEELAKERGAKWLAHLQRLTGKIAILKHENNKLRKANEFMRKKLRDNGFME